MMTFFKRSTAPLVMAAALAVLSCTTGSVEHVSGSISTPEVNADSVVVPYILVKHESAQSEFDDDEYTVTFKIRISVIGPSGTYAKRVDVSITSYAEDFPYVSSRIIPLLAGESYIVGSARIENFAAEVSSGFWAFIRPLQPILSRIDTNPEMTLMKNDHSFMTIAKLYSKHRFRFRIHEIACEPPLGYPEVRNPEYPD